MLSSVFQTVISSTCRKCCMNLGKQIRTVSTLDKKNQHFASNLYSQKKLLISSLKRNVSSNKRDFDKSNKDTNSDDSAFNNEEKIHGEGKFSVFKDTDADIILDVDEEKALRAQGFEIKKREIDMNEFAGINLERGETGVYDLEDLIQVLHLNSAQNIFVCSLPEEINYASYMVVVSGKSQRHMFALAEFIRRVYKKKCESKGKIPHIEGGNSEDWLALDLGNIIVHIMSAKARAFYDLECLWSVGAEYDSKMNDPDDPIVTMLQEHTLNLSDFQPIDYPSKS